jgi:hypothetical protein
MDALAHHPRVKIIHKPNEGHGPTIMRGYREAFGASRWVFQVDSDDEIKAECFPALWEKREAYDFILGVREGRKQSIGRRILSSGSRGVVRLLCGAGVTDVNAPFRLMRSERFASLLPSIPADTFAPNVALAGLAISRGFRIINVPVVNGERLTGSSSLISLKLVAVAWRSLVQIGRILAKERFKK